MWNIFSCCRDRAVFRGEEEDAAVLCSGSKSYEVRGAEVSNQLLFLSDLASSGDLPQETSDGITVITAHVSEIKTVKCPRITVANAPKNQIQNWMMTLMSFYKTC